jgi:hypothetical protein
MESFLQLKKKKKAIESKITTNIENLNTFMSSIFFPSQIKIKLLNNVAAA